MRSVEILPHARFFRGSAKNAYSYVILPVLQWFLLIESQRFARRLPVLSDVAARRGALKHVALLSFLSGLPLALTTGTLEAWAASEGFALKTIAWLGLAGFAYLLKPLIAPLIDAIPLRGSRRKMWIRIAGYAIVLCISGMAFGAAGHSLIIVAVAAFLLAFAAAFFDVAFNAWQIDRFRSVDTDYAVALSVWGFRCAMLVSGGIAVFYATSIGWAASLTGIALIALLLISTIKIDESPLADTVDEPNPWAFAWRAAKDWAGKSHLAAFVVFVVSFKLTDALAQALAGTMLLREAGFTLEELAIVGKSWGLLAGLIGSVLGAAFATRLKLVPFICIICVLQGATNLGYLTLLHGGTLQLLAAVVAFEQLVGGVGNAALLVLTMRLTNPCFSATQFGIWSSLGLLPRTIVAPIAAWGVVSFGWHDYLCLTTLACVPPIIAIWLARNSRVLNEKWGKHELNT